MNSKMHIPHDVRRAVALRHGGKPGEIVSGVPCAWCPTTGSIVWDFAGTRGAPSAWVKFHDLELDHVIPESRGGETTVDNITLACRRCNRSRNDKTLSEWLPGSSVSYPVVTPDRNGREGNKEGKGREDRVETSIHSSSSVTRGSRFGWMVATRFVGGVR